MKDIKTEIQAKLNGLYQSCDRKKMRSFWYRHREIEKWSEEVLKILEEEKKEGEPEKSPSGPTTTILGGKGKEERKTKTPPPGRYGTTYNVESICNCKNCRRQHETT